MNVYSTTFQKKYHNGRFEWIDLMWKKVQFARTNSLMIWMLCGILCSRWGYFFAFKLRSINELVLFFGGPVESIQDENGLEKLEPQLTDALIEI